MTAGVPRSARHVDPATRQMAEDLARRSGLTLQEWLLRLMAEGPEDATSQDEVGAAAGYLEPARSPSPLHEPPRPAPDEPGRIANAIERLSDRIETSETRQALAIAGVERSVREVIGRIDAAEHEQMHAGTQVDRALQEARAENQGLAGRVSGVEHEQVQIGARLESSLQEVKAGAAVLVQRLEDAQREQAAADARIEAVASDIRSEGGLLAERFGASEREQVRLGARVESAVQEVRADTLSLARRMELGERDRALAARRLDGALEELRGETKTLTDQVRELAERDSPTDSRLAALEAAAGRTSDQIQDVERKSREAFGELAGRVDRVAAAEQANLGAMRELRSTCAALDQRLGFAERGVQEGFERVAETLTARIEASRNELSQGLTAAVDARIDGMAAAADARLDGMAAAADARVERIEQTLADMGEHVKAAEARSTSAIERMGREVLEVARALNRRVQSVERQSAESVGRVDAQVSRIAGAVEDRMLRADSIQAQALERLGGEIARITERLSERIANSERRSAQAIDDVGEQVARVTDRITERGDRATSELIDRIQKSEERTARLLEETRQKIDERLAESHRRLAQPPSAAFDQDDDDLGPFGGGGPFPGLGPIEAEHPFPTAVGRRGEIAYPDEEEPERPTPRVAEPDPAPAKPAQLSATAVYGFEPMSLEPNQRFDLENEFLEPAPRAAQSASEGGSSAVLADPTSGRPADPAPAALSTREVIERARAAVRAAAAADPSPGSAARGPTRTVDDSVLQGLAFQRRRPRPRAGGMSGALMAAGVLAVMGVSAGGYMLLEGKPTGKLPKRVAEQLAIDDPAGAQSQVGGHPLAALAVNPTPIPDPSAAHASAALYSEAVAKISGGESGGLAQMQRLADRGYAPAQFYVAELYQDGKSGLARDAVMSRDWLDKAADGGDRTAMHNLALDYHDGVGGPKNAALAAEWFRRAAELGLTDSQFNLAALYEHGDGVTANPAEAYKWYLVASRSGDAGARAGALRARALLSPDARAVAERAAAEFRPSGAAPASIHAAAAVAPATPAAASAPSPDLETAQRALSQLGYFQGPTDGVSSPALRLALAAFQRDQTLPATGDADPATIAKLTPYAR